MLHVAGPGEMLSMLILQLRRFGRDGWWCGGW